MSISSEASVLLSLAYADQFYFPLTLTEIWRRLIKVSLSQSSLKKILFKLERQGLVRHQVRQRRQWWQLNNGRAQITQRLIRNNYSQQKWSEVDQLLATIAWIPWIEAVVVTGSLAVNNLDSTGDIDLMVITSTNRLWITRFLVSVSSLWAGKRRTWAGAKVDGWCFNLWLDRQSLALPLAKRTIYSAYEICQAKWVLDRARIKQEFLQANHWVKKLLPQYFAHCFQEEACQAEWSQKPAPSPTPRLSLAMDKFFGLLNLIFFKVQYLYMYPHMSREVVTLKSAYFHPRPTRGQIYSAWLKSLQRLQSVKGVAPKIVLVTGVFDLFHQEHQNFLRKAKAEGDLLLVGVETDRRVRNSKGRGRPVNDQFHRLKQLQLFPVVDWAFILPQKFSTPQDHLALLKKIKPQVLAVSSHTPHLREKSQLMQEIGGEVRVVHQQNPAISTTKMLS